MKSEFFIKNREKLVEQMKDDSLLLMFAGEAPKKTADESYPFTPNRNFYYLTGIAEEKIVLMITKHRGAIEEKLYIQAPDPIMEKWVGKTISSEAAKSISGIEKVEYLSSLERFIHRCVSLMDVNNIYLDLERDNWEQSTTAVEDFAKTLRKKYPQILIHNVFNLISGFRLVKAEEEVEEIKAAIDITVEAVQSLMKNARPEMMEYELEAYFDFTCKKRGVKDLAFKTIAASGENAAVLHYSSNNCKIKDGDLILFDLGAQLNYYNADITRTFPANGKFTDRQKQVYNAVLGVNEKIIEAIKPGVKYLEINKLATELIAEECIDLGLIVDKEEVSNYYFHSIGHSLGLDTHDVGKGDLLFEPGMVWTVEPGIYIPEEAIGVRIEDDIVVTEDGCEVLTKELVKSVEDIEAFMSDR